MKGFKSLEQLKELELAPKPAGQKQVYDGRLHYNEKNGSPSVDIVVDMPHEQAPSDRFGVVLKKVPNISGDKWNLMIGTPIDGPGCCWTSVVHGNKSRMQATVPHSPPQEDLRYFSGADVEVEFYSDGSARIVLPDKLPPFVRRGKHYAHTPAGQIQKHMDAIARIKRDNPDIVVAWGEVDEGDGRIEVHVAVRESKPGDLEQ